MQGEVRIKRFDPERDKAAHYETYAFPFTPGMSVLDAVFYIYENIDPALSFSYCCRNSHCGLCGAMINGKPGLMCRESATEKMVLEPLANLPVLRDLIVDREAYTRSKQALRLFLDRAEPYTGGDKPEAVDMEAFNDFKIASRCVECFCCIAACPVYAETPHDFMGPAAFAQLSRHAFDPRDDSRRDIMAGSGGLELCRDCGNCDAVCPHGVTPARYLAKLRRLSRQQHKG